MRTVLMDPTGAVIDPSMVPMGTMLPVRHFVTKAATGEVVLVAQIDVERSPQPLWNMVALG